MDAKSDRPVWGISEIEKFFETEFPQMKQGRRASVIEAASPTASRVRLGYSEQNLRPGGTIQGPALMALADIGAYVTILAAHGARGAGAVTTSLQMDFLRKPLPGDLVAETEVVKAGRTLIVCHVRIVGDGSDKVVAVCNCTYALPREE